MLSETRSWRALKPYEVFAFYLERSWKFVEGKQPDQKVILRTTYRMTCGGSKV